MSASELKLTIPVHNGELNPSQAQKFAMNGYLASRDGKAVVVTLSKPTVTRSLSANRYYWGVVLSNLAEHTGHTTEELHEVFKQMFLPRVYIAVGGVEIEVAKSTAKLTTEEFAKYLDQVTAWSANELGLNLPEPPITIPKRVEQ